MHEATEAYGADQNASIVRSSLLSVGPTLKVRGPQLGEPASIKSAGRGPSPKILYVKNFPLAW